MRSASPAHLPVALKLRWWGVVGLFGLAALGGYLILHVTWHPDSAIQWGAGSAGALLYLLGFTRIHLPLNRRHPEAAISPQLGLSNSLTLVRGLLYGLLAGFIVVPTPDGAWAWVPGLVYTIASLTDLLDGRIARKRGETTDLGAKLDVEVDSVGILIAFLLGAKLGQLPVGLVAAGALFYLYRLVVWGWARSGRPVYPLPDRPWRSIIGGFEVGFLCVMLWPVFEPPYTTAAGIAVVIPVVLSFAWDGLVATGALRPGTPNHQTLLRWVRRAGQSFVPRLLRIGLGLLIVGYMLTLWNAGGGGATTIGLSITLAGIGLVTTAGRGGRATPLALLVTAATLSLLAPPSYMLAIIVSISLVLMMTGMRSNKG